MRTKACVLVAVLAGLLLACSGAGTPAKVRTRDELKTALADKTKGEVLAILGKPADTFETDARESWRYERVSRDPVADRVDSSCYVRISKKTGRVEEVDCRP